MSRYSVKPALTSRRTYSFGDPLKRAKDVVRFGRLAEAGQLVDVNFDVTGEFVVAIFGKRGSGKSYCLGSFLESMSARDEISDIGRTSHERAVLVLDTLNIFWTLEQPLRESDKPSFAEEWKKLAAWGIRPAETEVTVFVPRGFGNATTPASYKELVLPPSALSAEDWANLVETDLYSDRVGQLLFDVYTKVADEGWIADDGPHPAVGEFQISDLLDCLRDDLEIKSYYSPETVRALGQRLKAVGGISFFGQADAPLRSILQPGRLSVLLLNRLPETLRSVLTSVLMRRILWERSEASELQKQLRLNRGLTEDERTAMGLRIADLIPPTVVALDEAQNVLPSERGTKATETIIKYVREGRNHGLSFVFTTQQPSAIDVRILAQVDTIVAHKLTIAADVRRLEDNLKARNPDAVQLGGRTLPFADWLRSLSPGQAIVSNTEEDRNFVVDVRPRVCPHGGQGVV